MIQLTERQLQELEHMLDGPVIKLVKDRMVMHYMALFQKGSMGEREAISAKMDVLADVFLQMKSICSEMRIAAQTRESQASTFEATAPLVGDDDNPLEL